MPGYIDPSKRLNKEFREQITKTIQESHLLYEERIRRILEVYKKICKKKD